MHVEHVFFIDARENPRWKVVLQKEVRSRRVHGSMGAFQDAGMFAIGEDAEHEGLRVPEVIPEENPAQLQTRRNVQRKDAFVPWIQQTDTRDENLGESGTSSEEDDN